MSNREETTVWLLLLLACVFCGVLGYGLAVQQYRAFCIDPTGDSGPSCNDAVREIWGRPW
jgi:hypothetical protein